MCTVKEACQRLVVVGGSLMCAVCRAGVRVRAVCPLWSWVYSATVELTSACNCRIRWISGISGEEHKGPSEVCVCVCGPDIYSEIAVSELHYGDIKNFSWFKKSFEY